MKLIEPLYSVFLVCNEVMIIHQVYNELSTISVTSFEKLLYVSKKKNMIHLEVKLVWIQIYFEWTFQTLAIQTGKKYLQIFLKRTHISFKWHDRHLASIWELEFSSLGLIRFIVC